MTEMMRVCDSRSSTLTLSELAGNFNSKPIGIGKIRVPFNHRYQELPFNIQRLLGHWATLLGQLRRGLVRHGGGFDLPGWVGQSMGIFGFFGTLWVSKCN